MTCLRTLLSLATATALTLPLAQAHAQRHRGRRAAPASPPSPSAPASPSAPTPPLESASVSLTGSGMELAPDVPSAPDGPLLLPVFLSDEMEGGFAGGRADVHHGLEQTPLLRRVRQAWRFRSNHDSVLSLEEHESVPPARLTSEQLAQWTVTSQDAVHQLALGDYDAARESLHQTQALSESAIEELNREQQRAVQVLDTCLFVVRAYVETRQFSRAEEQAVECRRLVPHVQPTSAYHPPEVLRALTQADALMAEGGYGSIVVRSDPTGCTVRLNGIAVGPSPYRVDDIARGEYRIQAECDARQRGRVYLVSLHRAGQSLRVDTRFDAALRSRPFPALVYRDVQSRDAHMLADAFRVARAVGASEVVLAIPQGVGLRLERVVMPPTGNLPPTRSVAVTRLSEGLDAVALAAALAQLEGAEGDARAASAPAARSRAASLPRWRLVTGLTAVGLSAASYAIALYQRARRQQRGTELRVPEFSDPDYLLRVNRFEDHQLPLRLLASTAGLFGLGAAALLTHQRRPRWLSLALVGVGGALILAAPLVVVTRPSCDNLADDRDDCIEREQRADLGFLLAGAGLPLLGAGLRLLLYPRASGDGLALSLSPRPDGASVTLRGSL